MIQKIKYKLVAVLSFLILIGVLMVLIFNTYQLQDREYNVSEKNLLNDEYGKYIPNDKIFPGGGEIIDSFLLRNTLILEKDLFKNRKIFKEKSELVLDSLFKSLIKHNKMDSIFNNIVNKNHLDPDLKYFLAFEKLEIQFKNGIGNIVIYDKDKHYPLIDRQIQTPFGIHLSGTLNQVKLQNRITHLSVNGSMERDYRITYSLYADRPNSNLIILYKMLPTAILVVICILIMMGINYYTYINWMRQKREAEVKTDFLNSIKHEFNTPITTILVASKSLYERDINEDETKVKNLAGIVERQAKRLQTHVNQMIAASVLHQPFNLEKTELNTLINVITDDYRIKLSTASSLIFKHYDREIYLPIDQYVFTTMLNNLLDNGFKFNRSMSKEVSIFISEAGSQYLIHIKDNGIGIDDKIKHKIFDKFYRPNINSEFKGLGLGLFYANDGAKKHHWLLNLNSKLDLGTEFIITIPKI